MDMLQKRLIAREVFLKLDALGYKVPREDPTPENRARWTKAFADEAARRERDGALNLPMLVVWTTSACTLNCKYCGNYTPLLRKRNIKYRYNFENFKEDLEKIVNSVNNIKRIVFGGWGGRRS